MPQKDQDKYFNSKSLQIKNIYWTIVGCIFLATFFVGYFLGKNEVPDNVKYDSNANFDEVRQKGYQFINPLLECEYRPNSFSKISFENTVKEKIEEEMKNNYPEIAYSVYFRNLNNGPWFGINEDAGFSPASLLKVPIMIAYFKQAERDSQLFNRKVYYRGTGQIFNQEIDPQMHIEPGREYAISELIERMIIHSDNEALLMLYQEMNRDYLNNVFKDLGVQMPDLKDANNMMSVKEYASFFRILYNASYLDRELSEKALEILSRVEYDEGLKAGIYSEILVAHKFGERESIEDGKVINQLHDCGIIYSEKYPYLLCIMTKGRSINDLSPAIKLISKTIFEKINEN